MLTKYVFPICLIAICGLCAPKLKAFCYAQTGGFALYKIQSQLPFNPAWEVSPAESDLAEIDQSLNQPYRYLAKGAQSFVFLSEDGKYVIKFFKLNHLQPPAWVEALHFPYFVEPLRLEKILQKREDLRRDFLSYKIAYEEFKEETGLVFVHLNKTKTLQRKLKIIDNLNIAYALDLDDMEFLVQRRATLFFPSLERIVQEKGMGAAEAALDDLLHLLTRRNQLGIFDKDPDLNSNFGFLEGRCVEIDVGRFRKDPLRKDPQVYVPEILRVTDHLNQWLRAHHPPLSSYLEEQLLTLKTDARL